MQSRGEKGNWIKKAFQATVSALKRAFLWIKRMIFGEKSADLQGAEIEKPSQLLKEAFFRRKTAVAALILLFSLFLFVFIAPLVVPMDVNYTDPLQQNVSPSYSMRAVPRRIKREIAEINGFADFTVGISKGGEIAVWGNTKEKLTKMNFKDIPKTVQEDGAVLAAAGKDHILALTKAGEIVGWGDKSCGQYGGEVVLNAVSMPQFLLQSVEPSSVKQIVCGYQTSAIVFKDGKAYAWGNKNSTKNLEEVRDMENVEKIVFTNSAAVVLMKDGQIWTGSEMLFTQAIGTKTGRISSLNAYMEGRKAVNLAASNKCIAILTAENELIVSGVFENGEENLPTLENGEYFTKIAGGTRHFAGVTNYGNVYAWGHNAYGQCEFKEKIQGNAAAVYTGALQTYVVDQEGALLQSTGLKGYLMGTDVRGRDVFTRIIHGGKMTMTIGAVAVLVSSVIGIIVGCVSGYFGGWVDTLLMRVTEIFSSMPFLPFAMLLSQIIKNYNIGETMRIFIIMLILGALSWTGLARMVRGQVLAEREKEFVLAAKAMGVKERKIAFRHVLPNVISVILVSMTLSFASCLLTESSLSYLGFGVQQPQPTWGNMLSGSNNSVVIQYYWWQWLFPAIFLSLATISINVIGDALRDALDPKSKER
ncbi:MAG: ABC transporter permease subunit [Clostridiales bacterium]|nr:ABC transporter permease subunit [Clostridiales bacterium]